MQEKLISKTKLQPSSNVMLMLKWTAQKCVDEGCIALWLWACQPPVLSAPLSSILLGELGTIIIIIKLKQVPRYTDAVTMFYCIGQK